VREHFDLALSAVLGKKRGTDNVEKTKQLLESMAVVKWGCEHSHDRCAWLARDQAPLNVALLWWRLVADCSPLEERSLCDAFNVVADDTAGGEQEDDDDQTAEQDADAAGQDDDEDEEPAAAAAGGMDKRTVIDALGFGHEEKVVLRFDDRFWEGTKGGAVSHWQCLDQRFRE